MADIKNKKYLSMWDYAKVGLTPGLDQVEKEKALQERADTKAAEDELKRAEAERQRRAGKAARKDVGY